MILVIDVGNTNITCGVFEGKKLTTTFRMMSRASHTSDEYGILLRELLRHNRIDREKLTGAIIASVVPNVMHALTGAIKRYLELDPLIVGNGIKTGIRITAENPKEIGPDRIVDVVAAYEKYGGPVLVLDFGTATTYDLVTADGKFGVGITAPGIRISAEALWNGAARLPEIEIRKPASILARETVSSMQHKLNRCLTGNAPIRNRFRQRLVFALRQPQFHSEKQKAGMHILLIDFPVCGKPAKKGITNAGISLVLFYIRHNSKPF